MKKILISALAVAGFFTVLVAQPKGVGVNTGSPQSILDVNGSLAVRAAATPLTLVNGANSNVDISSDFSFYTITGPGTAFSISGFTNGFNGKMLTIYNTTGQTLTLQNNTTSTIGNRISTLTGGDIVSVAANNLVTLQYNSSEQKWIVLSTRNYNGAVPAGSVTADNGLTVNTANNVQLGGMLAGNTDIALNSKNLVFSGTGNVGIGAPTPGAKLDVLNNGPGAIRATGSSTNSVGIYLQNTVASGRQWALVSSGSGPSPVGTFSIYDDNAAAARLNIDANGNVGIGVTAITQSFSGFKSVELRGNTAGGLLQLSTATADADDAQIGQVMWIDRNSTAGDKTVAQIMSKLSGTAANNRGSLILFSTKANNGALTERLRIDNAGNVGIGTNNPLGPLDVNGRASASSLKVSSAFGDLTNNSPWYGIGMSNLTLTGQGSTAVQIGGFYGINFAESGSNRMTINMGKVGINNTNPGLELDVTGGIKTSGNIYGAGYHPTGAGKINTWSMEVGGAAPTGTNGLATIFFHHHGAIAHQLRYTSSTLYWEKAGNGYGSSTTPNLWVGGDIYLGSPGVWLSSWSDGRLKKNIQPMQNVLPDVMKLQGVTFNWRRDEFPDKHFNGDAQIGFIAQEVEKIYPQVIMTNDSGYKSMDYAKLTAVLVEAVKEQQAQIEQLKNENTALKTENTAIKTSDKMQSETISAMKAQLGLINERLNIKSEK